jgi:polyferredoxin
MRRITQTFFLLLFLILLIESRLPQDIYLKYSTVLSAEVDLRIGWPVKFFFQLDPLVWLSSLLSGHHLISGFLWALGLLLLTLFLGRIFCGFICPLGTIHHVVSRIKPSLKGERMVRANQKTPSQKVKYFLLITLLLAAIIGLNLVGLMDPISLLFRSLALAVFPGLGVGLKELFDAMASSDIKILNQLSYTAEVLVSPVFGYGYPAYRTAWFMGLIFLIILFLNRIRPRFWCRTLCPLGALLGLCSRVSILKLEKDDEKCTNCKLCTKSCQGAASPIPGQDWENAECVACFNCFNACPEDALAFKLITPIEPKTGYGPARGARRTGGRVFPAPVGTTGWTGTQGLRPPVDQAARLFTRGGFPKALPTMRTLHESLSYKCDQSHPCGGGNGRILDTPSHHDPGIL